MGTVQGDRLLSEAAKRGRNQLNANNPGEQRVELLFRNGTITVVGIILAFSLGFLTQWANNPIPWTLFDLPTIVLISAGIAIQLGALVKLLNHDSLVRSQFDKATRLFVVGLVTTVAGVISAVVIDFVQLVA